MVKSEYNNELLDSHFLFCYLSFSTKCFYDKYNNIAARFVIALPPVRLFFELTIRILALQSAMSLSGLVL